MVSGQFDGTVRWRKGRSPGRDRDLATSDDAIPGAHERVMRQRVKLIVRSSCGVTERSASSAARHTSNQEPNTNKTKREGERESRRIIVCQELSIKFAEGVRIEEAGQQVAMSKTSMYEY